MKILLWFRSETITIIRINFPLMNNVVTKYFGKKIVYFICQSYFLESMEMLMLGRRRLFRIAFPFFYILMNNHNFWKPWRYSASTVFFSNRIIIEDNIAFEDL